VNAVRNAGKVEQVAGVGEVGKVEEVSEVFISVTSPTKFSLLSRSVK
jgi:hypothetical protein